MTTRARSGWFLITGTLLGICIAAATPGASDAQEASVPVPVMGRDVSVTLSSGEKVRGELIEAERASLLLWGDTGFQSLALDDVAEVSVRRHSLSGSKLLWWTGLGAAVTGLGMTAACASVDDTSCAGVFPAMVLTWGLFGGLFGAAIHRGSTVEVPVSPAGLQPYARFPQGAPLDFRERRSGRPR